jgi:hypothetical protein
MILLRPMVDGMKFPLRFHYFGVLYTEDSYRCRLLKQDA